MEQRIGEVHSEKDTKFNPPRPIFERRGATSGMDTVYNPDEAQRVISGSIKWDGCSNITLFEDEQGFVHFCGKDGAAMYGKLLEEIYNIATAQIPRWDGE